MLRDSAYLFLSKAAGYGIRILLPVALVRILTRDEFGAYNQFFLLEVLVQTVFQMGAIQSLFFFVPRERHNAGGYLLNSLVMNVAIYMVAYVFVWVFKVEIARELGMDIIHAFFWYLAFHSMLVMLNVLFETYCAARQSFKAASLLSMLRDVIATVATLIGALVFRSLSAIFLALIISRVVTLIISVIFVKVWLDGFRSERYFFGIREQLRYGVVLGLGGTIGTVAMRMHELAISRNFEPGDYAIYAAGLKQIPVLQFFGQSVAAVALGQFALLVKNEDWSGVRALWDRILGTMYGVGVPVALFFLAVAEPLVKLMFTPEYADAVSIFRINTVTPLALVLNATLVLRAMDRNDITLKVNLVQLALLPVGLTLGLKAFGMDGVIAVHAVLLLGNRVAAQACLNRLVPVHLAYVPSRRSLAEFYRTSWHKGLAMLSQRLSRR